MTRHEKYEYGRHHEMREYFCTHKLDNWDNKDKASGMLPFKRFLARDLHVKSRGRKEKAYSTHESGNRHFTK